MKSHYYLCPVSLKDLEWNKTGDNTLAIEELTAYPGNNYYKLSTSITLDTFKYRLKYNISKCEAYGPGRQVLTKNEREFSSEKEALRWLINQLEDFYRATKITVNLPYTKYELFFDSEIPNLIDDAAKTATDPVIRKEAKKLEDADYHNMWCDELYKKVFTVAPHLCKQLEMFLQNKLSAEKEFFKRLMKEVN